MVNYNKSVTMNTRNEQYNKKTGNVCTVRSEIRCALRLRYVHLVVSIEVAVEVCCCFSVFSC
jgi:hypothetical protein